MQRSIRVYVKDELFRGLELPPTSSRRYYPKIQDIRNHMYKAATKLKFSKLDQENLQQKVEEWRNKYPRDKFYYRGYGEVTDHSKELEVSEKFNREDEEDIFSNVLPTKQKLLFIHQTISQKELLYKYGNHICLLDATYKSTRYAILLFFVIVKTNSNYQVVASFAVQDETTDTITEALKRLSQWNPEWNPKCFMTDNCEAEVLSIENVFKASLFMRIHRIGISTEKRKIASSIKILEKEKEKQDMIEEYAPLDDSFYNIPIEPM
ncbi:uncharacterized protein LOC101241125 [Hydra vulgaris]|uniref:uncharacterized protein LOC101241125 n=1 Tax=Hydra vulgaris TaxID=6087 RepID=UPI0032EA5300